MKRKERMAWTVLFVVLGIGFAWIAIRIPANRVVDKVEVRVE